MNKQNKGVTKSVRIFKVCINYVYCCNRCTLNLLLNIKLSADLILVGIVFHNFGP